MNMLKKDISSLKFYSKRKLVTKILIFMVLLLFAILMIFPLLWMLSTALKPDYKVMEFPPILIPHPALWSNFGYLFTNYHILNYTMNSVFVTLMNIIGSVISCTVIAYGFAKYNAPGKKIIFSLLLATMMVPWAVTMVPLFSIFRELGLYNTYVPLWIRSFFGNAFLIFLLRQFMMGIPREMEEAAKIDGASVFQTLISVIVPMLKPPLSLVVTFTFFWNWNDFLGPLVYLSDSKKATIQLAIRNMQTQYVSPWNYIMAFSLLSILPCIIIFFIGQKQIIEGISVNGLK